MCFVVIINVFYTASHNFNSPPLPVFNLWSVVPERQKYLTFKYDKPVLNRILEARYSVKMAL